MEARELIQYLGVCLRAWLKSLVRADQDPRWVLRIVRGIILMVTVAFAAARLVRLEARFPELTQDSPLLLVYAMLVLGNAFMSAHNELFYDSCLDHHLLAPVPYRYLVVGKWLKVTSQQFGLRQAIPVYLLVGMRAFQPGSGSLTFLAIACKTGAIAASLSALGTLSALSAVSISPKFGRMASGAAPLLMALVPVWLTYWTLIDHGLPETTTGAIFFWLIMSGVLSLPVLWLTSDSLYRRAFGKVSLNPTGIQHRVPQQRWALLWNLTPAFLPMETRAVMTKDWRMLESNLMTAIRLLIWAVLIALPMFDSVRNKLIAFGGHRLAMIWGLGAWALCFSELVATTFTAEGNRTTLYRITPASRGRIILGKTLSNLLPYELGVLAVVITTGVALRYSLPSLLTSVLLAVLVTSCGTLWIIGFCSSFSESAGSIQGESTSLTDQVLEQAILSLPALFAVGSSLLLLLLEGGSVIDPSGTVSPRPLVVALAAGVAGIMLMNITTGQAWLSQQRRKGVEARERSADPGPDA